MDLDILNNKIKHDMNMTSKNREYFWYINNFYLNNINPLKNKPQKIITIPIDKKDTIKIVLDFFKSFDENIYQHVKSILFNNNNDFSISIYYKNANKKYLNYLPENRNLPKYSNKTEVKSNKQKIYTTNKNYNFAHLNSALYIPLSGNIIDVFKLAHELSHTFDLNMNPKNDYTMIREMFGEATPLFIETILHDYLIKNNILTKNYSINYKATQEIAIRKDVILNNARLILVQMLLSQGNISENSIKEYIQKNDLNKKFDTEAILNSICDKSNEIYFSTRYVIGNLLSGYLYYIYRLNPEKGKLLILKYWDELKKGNDESALKAIQLHPDINHRDASFNIMAKLKNIDIYNLDHNLNSLEQQK